MVVSLPWELMGGDDNEIVAVGCSVRCCPPCICILEISAQPHILACLQEFCTGVTVLQGNIVICRL